MYKPDRVIVRKIKEYDPHLFIEWNNQKQYFELWREMPHGRRLITPVTQSIYDTAKPIAFIQLDERLLWLIQEWDSWRHEKGPRGHVLEGDRRWIEWNKKRDQQKRSMYRDLAKDTYNMVTGFYTTKHASKNSGRPNLNKRWGRNQAISVRPDIKHTTSSRIFSRSKGNALKYFGGR